MELCLLLSCLEQLLQEFTSYKSMNLDNKVSRKNTEQVLLDYIQLMKESLLGNNIYCASKAKNKFLILVTNHTISVFVVGHV